MRTYEIVRSAVFDQKTQEIGKTVTQLFEIDYTIDHGLTRKPELLSTKIKGGYYLWVTKKLPYKIPKLRILYHLNDKEEKITLIDVGIKP